MRGGADLREPARAAHGRAGRARPRRARGQRARTAGSSRPTSSARSEAGAKPAAPAPPPKAAPRAPSAAARRGAGAWRRQQPAPPAAAYTEKQLSNMRKVIARRLTEAKQTDPAFLSDRRLRARRAAEAARGAECARGRRLQALGQRLRDQGARRWRCARCRRPTRSWGGDKIYRTSDVDIAVAVAIDDGLVTPVIRKADQKGLAAISNEMQDLVGARPRSRRHEAEARGVPGRQLLDLQPRHVRHPRVRRRDQPAAGRHPRGRRRRAAAGGQGRRARHRDGDDRDALDRPPGASTARSARDARGLQGATSKTRWRCCCERRAWRPRRPSSTTRTSTPGPSSRRRRCARTSRATTASIVEHLAEEIEDLGNSELHARRELHRE